jgi:hypothetical protein
MTRRKPKNVNRPTGIADDIFDGIRDIVSPWFGTPPGQNSKVTQAQGLARGAAETLDQTTNNAAKQLDSTYPMFLLLIRILLNLKLRVAGNIETAGWRYARQGSVYVVANTTNQMTKWQLAVRGGDKYRHKTWHDTGRHEPQECQSKMPRRFLVSITTRHKNGMLNAV